MIGRLGNFLNDNYCETNLIANYVQTAQIKRDDESDPSGN
jgi:hypothetical protein